MRLSEAPKSILRGLIWVYAYALSPLTGAKCRFHPSCSTYAMEALDRHGAVKGTIMAMKRLMKCHPWHQGEMLDPVPASIDWPALIGYKRGTQQTGLNGRNDKEDNTHAEP